MSISSSIIHHFIISLKYIDIYWYDNKKLIFKKFYMIIKKNEGEERHAHINKRENKRGGERRRDKGKRTEREYS